MDVSVADLLAIGRTLALYCQRCDDGDFEGLASLFDVEGTFVNGAEVISGRGAIVAWMKVAQAPEKRGKHLTTNHVVDVAGDGARASCDFAFFRRVDGVLMATVVGRYRDALVRRDGQWLIARREVERLP